MTLTRTANNSHDNCASDSPSQSFSSPVSGRRSTRLVINGAHAQRQEPSEPILDWCCSHRRNSEVANVWLPHKGFSKYELHELSLVVASHHLSSFHKAHAPTKDPFRHKFAPRRCDKKGSGNEYLKPIKPHRPHDNQVPVRNELAQHARKQNYHICIGPFHMPLKPRTSDMATWKTF